MAGFSKHSKNAISVYGDAVWRADFTGDANIKTLIGEWSKDSSAGTKAKQSWTAILDANGTHGTPASAQLSLTRRATRR